MEPTPGQRKGAFALIVVALAGLGIFLLRPGASGSAGPASSPAASRSALPPSGPAASPAAATQPPVATPAPATGASAAGRADIYQWLPFTAAELARAAAVATRIGALRAFGSASITFIVSISQKITDTRGVRRNTGQYAVTVTGSGASWLVSDIELASAGNS